jgi:hypothetical protein
MSIGSWLWLLGDLITIYYTIYIIINLGNIHDWICTKLSNLSLKIFRR